MQSQLRIKLLLVPLNQTEFLQIAYDYFGVVLTARPVPARNEILGCK